MQNSTKVMFPDQFKQQEKEIDRERQKSIMDALCSYLLKEYKTEFTYQLTKTGDLYDAMLIMEGEDFAIVEIKFRNTPAHLYPTYTIDARKIDHLALEASKEGLIALLVVSWNGDIRQMVIPVAGVKEKRFPTKLQQRRDRQEFPDTVYEIPMGAFSKIL